MSNAEPAAAIFGCAGLSLSAAERTFFAGTNPLGFILFARNCADPAQVSALVAELRDAVGRADAPVLIDQEGGRVARLRPPHWRAAPLAAVFGQLAKNDPVAAVDAVRLNSRLLAAELMALGIDVDCLPVLDVPQPGAHDVIGDRAYAALPETIAMLGRAACEGLRDGGVLPVVKHIPGHGRAVADSHAELPVVDAPLDELRRIDFLPFAALSDMPLAMTAHVVYTALDPDCPATLSPTVITEVIRGELGFSGVLMSDDLGMGALSGGFDERAAAVLDAGCDLVLHCSGDLDEMQAVSTALRPAAGRVIAGFEGRGGASGIDRAHALARLEALLAPVAESPA